MAIKFYRDYSATILGLESRFTFARLQAPQFRNLAAVLAAILFFGLILTWSRVRVLANNYQILELKLERDRLKADQLAAERRLAHMRSLAYAEEVARQQLGMVDINPNQVVVLKKRSAVRALWQGMTGWMQGSKK